MVTPRLFRSRRARTPQSRTESRSHAFLACLSLRWCLKVPAVSRGDGIIRVHAKVRPANNARKGMLMCHEEEYFKSSPCVAAPSEFIVDPITHLDHARCVWGCMKSGQAHGKSNVGIDDQSSDPCRIARCFLELRASPAP